MNVIPLREERLERALVLAPRALELARVGQDRAWEAEAQRFLGRLDLDRDADGVATLIGELPSVAGSGREPTK